MNTYKQQVTEEFLAAMKRRFPDIDPIELEKYQYIFHTGFNVGASCDNEIGREMMLDYLSNLYKVNVIN